MSELLEQFIEEGAELLDAAVNGLLEVERRPHDAELLNAVFRAAHTFKGSSGLFDFGPLTEVVHAAEDVLDAVRQERLEVDGEVIDAAMGAFDLARTWLKRSRATAACRPAPRPGAAGSGDVAQLLGASTPKSTRPGDAGNPGDPGDPRGLEPVPTWVLDALRELGGRLALDVLGGSDSASRFATHPPAKRSSAAMTHSRSCAPSERRSRCTSDATGPGRRSRSWTSTTARCG